MKNETDKLIKQQFESLPQALQRALTLTPWKETVKAIAGENRLDADKSQALETEAMLVMYGFEPQTDFSKNVISELSIDSGKAGNISKSINDRVFSVVLAKAEELAKTEEPTMQSAEEVKAIAQEIAPKVVVEAPKVDASRPSINLILPEPEEKLLEAPEPRASPMTLAPQEPVKGSDTIPAKTTNNIVEEKLSQVVATPAEKTTSYPDGKDPYREPII